MRSGTLYIIDAPNMVHRAAATGEMRPNLEAMLRRFLRVAAPQFVVAVWDDREASFRRELWPEYKANREHKDGIDQLFARAEHVFADFGIRSVQGIFGAEADDLIATIARKAPPGVQVVMLSADKDLFQLIDDRTFLAVRRRGKSLLYRAHDIRRKYGIEPDQWPAVQALAGGKNGVPGLPGIGMKGACTLLATYGDLEALLRRWKTVEKRSYRNALGGYADEARLYLDLMTLRTDLPIECRLGQWRGATGDEVGAAGGVA